MITEAVSKDVESNKALPHTLLHAGRFEKVLSKVIEITAVIHAAVRDSAFVWGVTMVEVDDIMLAFKDALTAI